MSVGGGGGKSSGKQSDPAAATLANLASKFAEESGGLRTGLIQNLESVLKTGGSNLPIVAAAEERSRLAGSRAMQDTDTELAKFNWAGTPFGERVRSETRTQAEQGAAGAKNAVIQSLFNMIPNFVLGQSQTAVQGLSGAVGGNVKASGKSAGLGAEGTVGGKK